MGGLLKVSWALLLAWNSVTFGNVIGTPQREFRQTYPLSANGRITLQNLYGDVRITAWDRNEVLVEAIKRAPDIRQIEDARIVVEPSDGMLSIRTQYAGSDVNRPASVEYRITVPRSASLQNIKLVNGGLSISGVTGPVKASSVNGNIHADRLEGQAELSTVNGYLEAAFDRLNRSNPISLTSVNGPIKLSIPCAGQVTLVARNTSGGIDSDVGNVWHASSGHRLVVKHGGPTIHLENVNGGISIRSSAWRRHT